MRVRDTFEQLFECHIPETRGEKQPCSIFIFGATGDLAHRKLIPALYHLYKEQQLIEPFCIIGIARRPKNDENWRDELLNSLKRYSRTQPIDLDVWNKFANRLWYFQGDVQDKNTYVRLRQLVESIPSGPCRENRLFYLATAPSQFSVVVEGLAINGLLAKEPAVPYWHRIIVEKPFGYDLNSANRLNELLAQYAKEHQIFRIDHYLGKETVQNLLTFRFSNAIFEELWTRATIDHIQITVAEKQGIGQRGGYYEEAGALRDIFQNHLLQLLALLTMEPPVSLDPEAIRDEKVKLLRSIRPIKPSQIDQFVARGQYFAGYVDGELVPGYRQEQNVSPTSNVETFIAVCLHIDSWRWAGVPFFIRSGKRMPVNRSEIYIQFQNVPNILFAAQCNNRLQPNAITIRLQPDEGISLMFNAKVPGTSMRIRLVEMHFSYNTVFGAYTPEAYERLLLDAIEGDPTLFLRRDEIEQAWRLVDSIREGWGVKPLTNKEFYAAGSWGPVAAEELINKMGRAWKNPPLK